MNWRLPRLRADTPIATSNGIVTQQFQLFWSKVMARIEQRIRTSTASETVEVADDVILADATAGAVTITLPLAAESKGRVLTIIKKDSSVNAVTVDGNGAETINGAATQSLAARYDKVTVISDAIRWWLI